MDLFEKAYRFEEAHQVQRAGLYPYFRAIADSDATEVTIQGKRLVMVGSNNYLGLTHHPKVIEAAIAAAKRFGSGCTGSRFLNGTLELHEELERRLAVFLKRESCLAFSTGFQACLGVISAIAGKDDVILCDRDNHASIIDGCRLSFAKTIKYAHNDMRDLEEKLLAAPAERGKLIVADGVFSMLGDVAKLPEMVALARRHGARVLVDDAHAFGVLGRNGRGTAEHHQIEDEVDLVMGTFSKSLASIGGFVAGEEQVVHYLKHKARSLMFSASLPPASTAGVLAALDLIEKEPQRRTAVWKNADRMRAGFASLGLDTGASETPVVPVILGERGYVFLFWRKLFDRGVFTNPVAAPGVPEGMDLLRTSYMATHTDAQLDFVLEQFAAVLREMGPPPRSQRQVASGAGAAGVRA
ncbi:MAG TPA: pyridoxal phosphate-dependent aminotransferase family protein [Planctomycetota bacterium]|nr:pyridoxal phosphate-dependent aminotransferase family protein [Planctomycetota bacterium]